MTRVVLVPGVLALLPEYAGLEDPVADLRAACLSAVSWLGSDVEVLADEQGARVAEHLLDRTVRTVDEPSCLVVGNGSARRSDRAPGFVDTRSASFDSKLRAWLHGRGPLDTSLADELLASVSGLKLMAERFAAWGPPRVDYDDDPYGVQYWVCRWEVGEPDVHEP